MTYATCPSCHGRMDEDERVCPDCEAAWDAMSAEPMQAEDTESVRGSGFCQCGTPVESDELGALCRECRRARREGRDDFAPVEQ